MKKKTMERQEARARTVYVPPRIEEYEAAPDSLLGNTSFYSIGHALGDEKYEESDHNAGHIFEPEYGAKAVILGQEFNFSDLWEE